MIFGQYLFTRKIRLKNILLPLLATFFVFVISAQPSIESFATSETGGSGNLDLSAKPSGVTEGDLLVSVACYESGSSQTISSPVGWTLIAKTDNGSDIGIATFYKIADAADVAIATFTFSLSEDKKWTLGVSRISNADEISPINVFSENSGDSDNAIASSVTSTVDDCLILSIYGNKKDATYAGSFNEEYEIEHSGGQIASQMLESFVQSNAGPTMDAIATPSNTDAWITQQIAIRKSNVVLLNNFRSITTGDFDNNITWEREQSNGIWLSPSNISPPSDANIIVRNGHTVTGNESLLFFKSQVTVETGGIFNILN